MDFPQISAFRGGADLVRVVGHRGARGVMPENTLPGFEWTLSMGVDLLEFDVVLTRDKVPVIVHDTHLSAAITRTAGGTWIDGPEPAISVLDMNDLRGFDVGALNPATRYARQFPDQASLDGVAVPALADLLMLIGRAEFADARLLLEMKTGPETSTGMRHDLVTAVLEQIREHGVAARTVLHSFDWPLLDICRSEAPDMPRSYLSERPGHAGVPGEDATHHVGPDYAAGPALPRQVADCGGQMWCPYLRDVTAPDIAIARDLDLPVIVWTVNEPTDIERMIGLGVDAIVTDYPGRVQQHLRRRNLRWR